VVEWTADAGQVRVFVEGDEEPFLSWKNEETPFEVRNFGVRTAWGASGDWKIDGVKEVHTDDGFTYTWFPVHSASLAFKVKAKNDAHVILAGGSTAGPPCYEVFFGGWTNSKHAIRVNQEKPDVAEAEGSLSGDEAMGFWVKLDHGQIRVGKEGEGEPIMAWAILEPMVVSHFGVRTSWGSTGEWVFEDVSSGSTSKGRRDVSSGGGSETWVAASDGSVPEGALVGGEDGGAVVYVARAEHEGGLLPGKLVEGNGMYIPWGGEEHVKDDYQVLIMSPDAINWVDGKMGDDVPAGCVEGGHSEDGEVLYVGRAQHEGTLTVGKFHPSHGKVYISFGGQEIGVEEFQLLVRA